MLGETLLRRLAQGRTLQLSTVEVLKIAPLHLLQALLPTSVEMLVHSWMRVELVEPALEFSTVAEAQQLHEGEFF